VPSISSLISRAAHLYASATAVDDGRRAITFTEVDRRSTRLANRMSAVCPPGARVAVLAKNRAELVEIDFAIAKLGAIRVPVNTRLTDDEIGYVLADSGASLLVTEDEYAERAYAWTIELETLQAAVIIDSTAPGMTDYETYLAEGSPNQLPGVDDPAAGSFILYTSGTTGRPKGALSTVGGRIAATSAMLRDELVVPVGGGMVHCGSMAHGSGSKVLAYFIRGARNMPLARWDPEALLALAAGKGATGTFLVPTMLTALAEAASTQRWDYSSLCSISYGGAPISRGQLEVASAQFPGALVQVYGSCEAPHPVLTLSRADHASGAAHINGITSVGRETLECDVRLVDERGADVAPGDSGEMWIKGRCVMAGYWDKPEATGAVLTDGWYHSGDVARRDETGYFYIVDRLRDMIITGGLNVYPAEVERALHEHPAVAEVAVVGIPNDKWGEEVKAFVVARPGEPVSEAALIEHCRVSLAGYKKPRSVQFVGTLPRGSTGKILKRQLRDQYWHDRQRNV
jgi:acyl-CoA synthetase (AMP-forming)/AMP-acid ligase II